VVDVESGIIAGLEEILFFEEGFCGRQMDSKETGDRG
jgi:hypothetical protein